VLMVQFGGQRFHPGAVSLLDPVLMLVVGVCAGALGLLLLNLIVPRVRGALRRWRTGRRRARAVAVAELRARALMSELCPHGWRAQITLFESSEEPDSDGPPGERSRVALDWVEIEGESGRAAVMRRVWAPTIAEALEAMVADRRTDETLEQIEQGAVADGAWWPDA
jgi:hypothetical protein